MQEFDIIAPLIISRDEGRDNKLPFLFLVKDDDWRASRTGTKDSKMNRIRPASEEGGMECAFDGGNLVLYAVDSCVPHLIGGDDPDEFWEFTVREIKPATEGETLKEYGFGTTTNHHDNDS